MAKKNSKKKLRNKGRLPEAVAVSKTRMARNDHPLPEKFKEMDEMLKKTTFLPK